MKKILRYIFYFIFIVFESGTEPFVYKYSHRKILIVVGVLFSGLASLVFWLALGKEPEYLFPVFVFGGAGLISLLIGFAGTDRAVAKIWGSR